jgi:D-sedoheptulose 7-phosphate isomerase
MLDIESMENKFRAIVATDEFQQLQELYNDAKHVFFFGHGGNMSIAEHAAVDASRLTDKNVYAPGGGVVVTSIQGDTSFNDWIQNWLEIRTRNLDKSECLAIGLSCSTNGASSDCLATALNWAADQGIPSALWAAQPKEKGINPKVIQVIQHAKYYHTSEILSLTMTYQLIHDAGFMCPTISKKAQERRFEKLGIESEVETHNQEVPPGLESQLANLAIDFDGVVHTFDKGWHDGTCYGAPIEGALEAIKSLADDWNIIIFSAKVRPDRPFVNGKTGYELVDEWLEFHGVRDYVSEITHEKPRAKFYIDDKAIEFTNNWSEILERLK